MNNNPTGINQYSGGGPSFANRSHLRALMTTKPGKGVRTKQVTRSQMAARLVQARAGVRTALAYRGVSPAGKFKVANSNAMYDLSRHTAIYTSPRRK